MWHYLKPGSRILSKSNSAVRYRLLVPDFGIDLEPFLKELFTIAEGNSTKLEQVFAINHSALLVCVIDLQNELGFFISNRIKICFSERSILFVQNGWDFKSHNVVLYGKRNPPESQWTFTIQAYTIPFPCYTATIL